VIVIGLTGGIGAGKSTFAALLADLGAAVIDVDAIGRDVIAPGTDGAAAVLDRFGTTDRRELAALVFHDPSALRDLEAISWPRIEHEVGRRVDALAAAAPPVVVLDMAVLDKGLGRGIYRHVITVEATEDARIARLVERGMTAEDALARMRSQLDPSFRRTLADLVVENDGDLDDLRRAARDALERFLPSHEG
jgi:dephospho-CoA kinase